MWLNLSKDQIYNALFDPNFPEGVCGIDKEGYWLVSSHGEIKRGSLVNIVAESPERGANLNQPFTKGYLRIERIGNGYRGGVILDSDKNEFFRTNAWRRVNDGLIKEYRHSNQYHPTELGGYVLFKTRDRPFIAIDASRYGVSIVTGTQGVKLRSLINSDDFASDMTNIEKLANQVLSFAMGKGSPEITFTLDL